MWVWVDRLALPLFDASVAAVVLWSVAALAMLLSEQPARRLRLARAAAWASLAVWPLVGGNLVPRLDLIGRLTDAGVLPHPALSALGITDAGAVVHIGEAAAGPTAMQWAARGLTLAYLGGVACGLGWLALGFLAVGTLTRRSRAPSAEVSSLYDALPCGGRRSRPRLRVTDRVSRPVLAGVFRPVILIPDDLDAPPPDGSGRLRLSLLHELAHAAASDPWHALIENLARGVWFFVPPSWWVSNQARLDREFVADRRAASEFGPLREYASALLEFAATRPIAPAAGSPDAPGNAVGEGGASPLFQRVLMLVRCPFPVELSPPVWWSWELLCAGAVVALGASSLSLRPPVPAATAVAPSHRFHLSRFETEASPDGPEGQLPFSDLPIRLPERFELTAEVWGDPARLAGTRIAGLPLAVTTALDDPERWHLVHIHCDRDGVRLWVDGRAVSLGRRRPVLTAWLTVQTAANLPANLRNLTLIW